MIAYHKATSLQDALEVLAREPARKILAGGTDVYPAKATRAGWGHMSHPDVIDIWGLDELRGIERCGETWRIGALATWSKLIAAPLPAAFDGLKLAAREVGSVQVQNRGTIAGNICNASPAADGMPPLLCLDAQVEVVSLTGKRLVPLSAFVDGYRHTVLQPGELVTAIEVRHGGGQGDFLKLGARRYLVISIAMAASVIDLSAEGTIRTARVAVGSCSAVAQRLERLETSLIGKRPDPALVTPLHLDHLTPLDDVRASATYRHAAALALVKDLLASARLQDGGRAA